MEAKQYRYKVLDGFVVSIEERLADGSWRVCQSLYGNKDDVMAAHAAQNWIDQRLDDAKGWTVYP